jgi:hypothetical protein
VIGCVQKSKQLLTYAKQREHVKKGSATVKLLYNYLKEVSARPYSLQH